MLTSYLTISILAFIICFVLSVIFLKHGKNVLKTIFTIMCIILGIISLALALAILCLIPKGPLENLPYQDLTWLK